MAGMGAGMGALFSCLLWLLCFLCWQRKKESHDHFEEDDGKHMHGAHSPLLEETSLEEQEFIPVFIPGKGTVMLPREDKAPFANLEGPWVVDGYLPVVIDKQGKTMFNGKHYGDKYDLHKDAYGNIVRGDGWIVAGDADVTKQIVWMKEDEDDVVWVRGTKKSVVGHQQWQETSGRGVEMADMSGGDKAAAAETTVTTTAIEPEGSPLALMANTFGFGNDQSVQNTQL